MPSTKPPAHTPSTPHPHNALAPQSQRQPAHHLPRAACCHSARQKNPPSAYTGGKGSEPASYTGGERSGHAAYTAGEGSGPSTCTGGEGSGPSVSKIAHCVTARPAPTSSAGRSNLRYSGALCPGLRGSGKRGQVAEREVRPPTFGSPERAKLAQYNAIVCARSCSSLLGDTGRGGGGACTWKDGIGSCKGGLRPMPPCADLS